MKVIFFNTNDEQFYGVLQNNQVCGISVVNGKLINCSKGVQDLYKTADFYPQTICFNNSNIQIARIQTNKQLFVMNDDTISDDLPDMSELCIFIQDNNPVLIITNISQLAQKSFKSVIDAIVGYKTTLQLLKQSRFQFTFKSFKDAIKTLFFMKGTNTGVVVGEFDIHDEKQVMQAFSNAFVENRIMFVQTQKKIIKQCAKNDNLNYPKQSQRLSELENQILINELSKLSLNKKILQKTVKQQQIKQMNLVKLLTKAQVENFVNLKLFEAGVFVEPLAPFVYPKIITASQQMKNSLQAISK